MKYLFFSILSISVVFSVYFLTKCDSVCSDLKQKQQELNMQQAIERDKFILQQNEANRLSNIEREKNTVTVRRDTDQVIADRLLERGTDIGVNIGLNILSNMLR